MIKHHHESEMNQKLRSFKEKCFLLRIPFLITKILSDKKITLYQLRLINDNPQLAASPLE